MKKIFKFKNLLALGLILSLNTSVWAMTTDDEKQEDASSSPKPTATIEANSNKFSVSSLIQRRPSSKTLQLILDGVLGKLTITPEQLREDLITNKEAFGTVHDLSMMNSKSKLSLVRVILQNLEIFTSVGKLSLEESLDEESIKNLARKLPFLPNLKKLYLDNNKLGAPAFSLLRDYFSANAHNLQELSINRNPLTREDLLDLFGFVFHEDSKIEIFSCSKNDTSSPEINETFAIHAINFAWGKSKRIDFKSQKEGDLDFFTFRDQIRLRIPSITKARFDELQETVGSYRLIKSELKSPNPISESLFSPDYLAIYNVTKKNLVLVYSVLTRAPAVASRSMGSAAAIAAVGSAAAASSASSASSSASSQK